MDLTIVDGSRNTTEEVAVPASVATERIVTRLTQIWRLPVADRDGRAVSYRLQDARSGCPIDPSATLADAGVSEHDVLRLVACPAAAIRPLRPKAPAPPRPVTEPPTAGPMLGDPGAGHAAPEHPRAHRGPPASVALASAVVLACVAVGAAFASGAFSSGGKRPAPAAPASAATSPESSGQQDATGQPEQASDRAAIMRLLVSYQQAYSSHDVQGLEQLFSQDVRRHGLAKGGCTISEGMSSVLASYQSQFEAGSGSYTLVALSEEQIQLDSATQAHFEGHYTITPGGSGYVDFEFTEAGGAWEITEVNAACH